MNIKDFFYTFGKSIYHIDEIYANYAKKSGVTPTLLWVLYAINDGKAHTQKDVCYDWSLPKSTVNTLTMELKEKGYIDLIHIKGKRREMTIQLTSSGKEYADSILEYVYGIEKKVFNEIDFDVNEFIKNLIKLENALENKYKEEI